VGIPVSFGLDGKTSDILEENYQDVLPEQASGPASVRFGEIILSCRVVDALRDPFKWSCLLMGIALRKPRIPGTSLSRPVRSSRTEPFSCPSRPESTRSRLGRPGNEAPWPPRQGRKLSAHG
jgi:hypothetical protein